MRRLCWALLGIVLSGAACGQDPGPAFADYNHAVRTASDGAPAHISRMAQTPDGWLWLGTPHGLYRFDGEHFYTFAATNGAHLLSPRIWDWRPSPTAIFTGVTMPRA